MNIIKLTDVEEEKLVNIVICENDKNDQEFNTLIDFRECDFMEMIDISSIFSNLIDNAIEACANVDLLHLRKISFIMG